MFKALLYFGILFLFIKIILGLKTTMVTKILSFSIVLFAVLILVTCNLFAQEENVIIKNYNLELAKISPPHKMLSKLDGEWKLHYRLWIDPNSDPEEGDGTAKANIILGGRFLQINMDYAIYEKAFTSEHIVGYDMDVKRFSLFSIDEFGTDAIFLYGDLDLDIESVVFAGVDSISANPSTGEKSYQYKIELYIPTEEEVDQFGFNTYFLDPEGKWKPLMETSFTKNE
jgi:hypothetical protein